MTRKPARMTPDKREMQNVARVRIETLLKLAGSESTKNPERAKRYVELAGKIGTRYNVRFSKQEKILFCKECNSFYTGTNLKVRLNPKTKAAEYECLKCGRVSRHGYSKKPVKK